MFNILREETEKEELQLQIEAKEKHYQNTFPSNKEQWELDAMKVNMEKIIKNKNKHKPCKHDLYRENGQIKCKKCETKAIRRIYKGTIN